MPLEQDVLDVGKQLEKLVSEGKSDNEAASDLLNRLKELPITLDILQKTRIGMAVNVVRKASTKDDIQAIAKALIKSWKKLLDGNDKNKTQRQTSQDKSDSPSVSRSSSTASLPRTDSSSSNGTKSNSNTTTQSFPPSKRPNDPIRNRCIEMIINSLKSAENSDVDYSQVAVEVEDAIYRLFKNTDTKYKNRVKSRVMNLRDKRNAQLRLLVANKDITPDRFANMTSEEMACEDLKKERTAITQQAIKDHQLATNAGTSTGQFKCGKCGKRNTTYNQLQTRSADEPMTTFVYCNECGNRWKFC